MRIAALVLAAGRSTRMGANKLLEVLHEKPLVRHVVDAARMSDVSDIFVVTGHECEKVESALADCHVRFIHNPHFADGLSTSLKAGLIALPKECEGVVILLGDMPLVTAEIINALKGAIERAPNKSAAVPVHNLEWGNPVLLMRACFAEVGALTGDAGARKYLATHRDQVLEVPVNDPCVLVDLDTPEALARARMAG